MINIIDLKKYWLLLLHSLPLVQNHRTILKSSKTIATVTGFELVFWLKISFQAVGNLILINPSTPSQINSKPPDKCAIKWDH